MNDEEYGVAALSVLRRDPPALSEVDVSRAVREARTNARRRLTVAGAGFATVAAAAVVALAGGTSLQPGADNRPSAGPDAKPTGVLPTDPALPKSCVVTSLPVAGAKGVLTAGMDPTGHWVIGTGDPYLHPAGKPANAIFTLVWHDGQIVAKIPAQVDAGLVAINSAGVAVGGSESSPYAVRNGTKVALQGHGTPLAINNAGVVVGKADGHAVRWNSLDAAPQALPTIGGDQPESSYLITDEGLVIGANNDTVLLWYANGRTATVKMPTGLTMGVPMAYRNGWIYFKAMTVDGAEGIVGVRYAPSAGVWQKLGSLSPVAALAPGSDELDLPWILVGNKPVLLPKPANAPGNVGYTLSGLSDDARRISGDSQAKQSDPTVPVTPLWWTCQ